MNGRTNRRVIKTHALEDAVGQQGIAILPDEVGTHVARCRSVGRGEPRWWVRLEVGWPALSATLFIY